MDLIRFPCGGCGAKLGAGTDAIGKLVACPKCKHKSTVPAFEVIEEPPAPPPPPPVPEEPIRFPCAKCGVKLKAVPSKAGQGITCPKCGGQTLVPDEEEEATYGLGNKPKVGKADRQVAVKAAPIDEWWPDEESLPIPFSWKHGLRAARSHAEKGQWKSALTALNELREKGRVNDVKEAHILRKPLAYCLGRWAARELEKIEDGEKLSKPVRSVLKQAGALQRWGGSFDSHLCPLCGRHLDNLIGTTQMRTTAGSAYLCCARPTASDDALIRQVDRVSKKLFLATGLDPENPEVPATMARLPQWYKAVDLSESGWVKDVRDITNQGGGGGGVVYCGDGGVLGEAVGNALANILFG